MLSFKSDQGGLLLHGQACTFPAGAAWDTPDPVECGDASLVPVSGMVFFGAATLLAHSEDLREVRAPVACHPWPCLQSGTHERAACGGRDLWQTCRPLIRRPSGHAASLWRHPPAGVRAASGCPIFPRRPPCKI